MSARPHSHLTPQDGTAEGLILVDKPHAARLLSVDMRTIERLVSCGELSPVPVPCPLGGRRPLRRVLFDRRDLLAAIGKWKAGAAR